MIPPEDVYEASTNLLKSKPQYASTLQNLLEYEESLEPGRPRGYYDDSSPTGKAWEVQDAPIAPARAAVLSRQGILHLVHQTNRYKVFCLAHPDQVQRALRPMAREKDLAEAAAPRPGKHLEIDQIWQRVYGYPKVKKWCRRYLERDINICLAGVPGSAKTVMLRDIGRLPNGYYRSAVHFSKRAMFDFLYYNDVDYFALDEADELSKKDWAHIYNMAWDGYIELNLKDDYRHKEMKPVILIGLNDESRLPEAIVKRFKKIRMDPYTAEEYERVGFECLVNDEGVDEDLARFIVAQTKIWTTDVRQAIMYGRACDNEEEVLEMLELDRERGWER